MVNAAASSIRAREARRSGVIGVLAGMIGGLARRLSSRGAKQCPGMTLAGKLVATCAMPPKLLRVGNKKEVAHGTQNTADFRLFHARGSADRPVGTRNDRGFARDGGGFARDDDGFARDDRGFARDARGVGFAIAALLLLVLLAARGAAAADSGPFLVLETGVHEAAINAMAPLVDGSGLVTVSDDKTARLWRPGGTLPMGILLPPIGPGDSGALYAVATSAHVIAVAGRIHAAQGGFGIAFYSAQDGRSLALISGLPSAVLTMKMSPDGGRLAVGLEGGGLRVFDLKNQSIALQDADQYPGKITSLDFDPAGRLAVAADDNSIRLYDASLHRLPPMTLHAGARAYGVAFSPDGTKLAAGDRTRPVVHLFDMRSGRFERDLEGTAGKGGSFNVVAFSADGASVYGAGSYLDNAGTVQIRRWPLNSGAPVDISVAHDLVTSLVPTAAGLMFATAEPVIGSVDAANRVQIAQSPRHIDFHDRADTTIRLSHSGAGIEITEARRPPLIVDVTTREILPSAVGRDFAPPVTTGFGMTVTDWHDSRTPLVNGQKLGLESSETARSAAVSPAGAAVGTDFFVRFVGRNGNGWKVAAGSPVWSVAASADGRLVVACFGDGTIHWYNAGDGRELIALFIDPATQRLVQWTPAGYFDHDHRSDGKDDGRSLIGYRIDEPNGRTSDFISIGQLYPTWFRPDMVGLSFRDDPNAQRRVAQQEAQSGTIGQTLADGLPPKVTVLDACAVESLQADACGGARLIDLSAGQNGTPPSVTEPMLLVRFKVEDPNPQPGQIVPKLNDAVFTRGIKVDTTAGQTRIEHAVIPLMRGLNVIKLSSISGSGGIEASATATPEIRLVRAVDAQSKEPSPTTPGGPTGPGGQTGPGGLAGPISPTGPGGPAGPVSPSGPGGPAGPVSPSGPGSASGAITAESNARLYVLTVGVSKLADPDWNLANPANDATALAQVLSQDRGHLYAEVIPKTLTDATATKANILAAMKDIAANATADDVVVIFLAGHGRTVDGHYYFAPSDMGLHDPALLAAVKTATVDDVFDKAVDAVFRTEGLGQDDLLPIIQGMQATRIAFMLDTCYSATLADADAVLRHDVNNTITDRIGHASGRFVLSGSFTEAFDSAAGADSVVGEEGHGLFTSYLLRALQGDAGTDGEGRIDIYKLATFTRDHVMSASKRILDQTPGQDGSKPNVQRPAYYFAGNDFFAVHKLAAGSTGK